MRRTSLILCTASAIAIVLGATPALAQQVDPATPPDPNVEAQETPAPTEEEGSPQTDDAVQTTAGQDQATPGDEAIVVTGLRRSLQSAQNIKRNSEQVVDSIVAEDIGKLPDVTASAALARVTGVQVTRAAAEAADVQIRGLPDISTTYNGREIFTSQNRFVAIQDFPAGGVAALEVFKSSTANLIEPGLGGQVNVRSRRPFDFSGREISGSFNIVKFEQSGKWDWNGNLLLSDRWQVGDGGEIGVLVNAARSGIRFLDSTREQAEFIQFFVPVDGQPGAFREAGGGERGRSDVIRAPDAVAVFFGAGDRKRPSINGAVQYKPHGDLQFYIDGLFQGYRAKDTNLYFRVPLYCGPILTNVVLKDGTNQAESASATGGCDIFGINENFKNKTDTYQVGGGVIYDFEPFRISGDLAYTDSTYNVRQINLDVGSFGPPARNVVFDSPNGNGGPTFDLIDFDTTNPEDYRFGGLFFRKREEKGKDIQGRVDLEWGTQWAAVPRVQVGLRRNHRTSRARTASRFEGNCCNSFADLPVSPKVRFDGFAYDNIQPEEAFLGFDVDEVFNNLEELRDFVGLGPEDPDWNPLEAFSAKERATAGYGQLKYEFDAGFPIDGVAGLRAVRTRTGLRGTRRIDGVDTPLSVTNTYTDFLPNVSGRFRFTPNLQGRLAYTQTRTRPSFADLSPSATIDPPPTVCETNPEAEACFRTARGGNPDLAPINSNNLDATLEYYFARTGSATIALFRRKVRGFIFNDVFETEDPDLGRIRFTQSANAGSGKIRGVELAATAFADFTWLPEWARGFGAQANYTYIDASTELSPRFRAARPGQQGFPNISKHSYNLVGIYERGPISTRLAYNFRSKFIREYLDIDGFVSPRIEDGHGVLDFSASYTPFENVTFAFDALNILAGDPIRTYRAYNDAGDTFPFQRRYLERVFSFGVRLRHGGGGRSREAAPAPVLPPPPPPPVIEPAPVAPPPPPPPPPAVSGERGL